MKLFIAIALVALVVACADARAVRDTKSDLMSQGDELLKKANEVIAKLQTNPLEAMKAGAILAEETMVKGMMSMLQMATDPQQIAELEKKLANAMDSLKQSMAGLA